MATLSPHDFSPRLAGRGLWNSIHQHAARAVIEPQHLDKAKWAVLGTMRDMICLDCREHIQDYIAKFPVDQLNAAQFLEWTYHAHVNANSFTSNPTRITLGVFKAFYLGAPTCKNCHHGPVKTRTMGISLEAIKTSTDLYHPDLY